MIMILGFCHLVERVCIEPLMSFFVFMCVLFRLYSFRLCIAGGQKEQVRQIFK